MSILYLQWVMFCCGTQVVLFLADCLVDTQTLFYYHFDEHIFCTVENLYSVLECKYEENCSEQI
jgi:hypothetical protein